MTSLAAGLYTDLSDQDSIGLIGTLLILIQFRSCSYEYLKRFVEEQKELEGAGESAFLVITPRRGGFSYKDQFYKAEDAKNDLYTNYQKLRSYTSQWGNAYICFDADTEASIDVVLRYTGSRAINTTSRVPVVTSARIHRDAVVVNGQYYYIRHRETPVFDETGMIRGNATPNLGLVWNDLDSWLKNCETHELEVFPSGNVVITDSAKKRFRLYKTGIQANELLIDLNRHNPDEWGCVCLNCVVLMSNPNDDELVVVYNEHILTFIADTVIGNNFKMYSVNDIKPTPSEDPEPKDFGDVGSMMGEQCHKLGLAPSCIVFDLPEKLPGSFGGGLVHGHYANCMLHMARSNWHDFAANPEGYTTSCDKMLDTLGDKSDRVTKTVIEFIQVMYNEMSANGIAFH